MEAGSLDAIQGNHGIMVYLKTLCLFWIGKEKKDTKTFINSFKDHYDIKATTIKANRERQYNIKTSSIYGPQFYRDGSCSLLINQQCDEYKSCFLRDFGEYRHLYYKKCKMPVQLRYTMFTRNYFTILDYEVYCKDCIYSCCMCH